MLLQELELKEQNLQLAAEIGKKLLEENTELELQNQRYADENSRLQQQLQLHKSRSKGVIGEIEQVTERTISLEEDLQKAQQYHLLLKREIQQLNSRCESYKAELDDSHRAQKHLEKRIKELQTSVSRVAKRKLAVPRGT